MILFGAFQLGHAVNLDCSFDKLLYRFNGFNSNKYYTCRVTSFENGNNDKIMTGYTGKHLDKKDESDVKMIYMSNLNVKFIPENIGLLFNLAALSMRDCELIQIRTKDFNGMEDLEYMDLAGNKLKVIPSNAFYSLKSIRSIELSYNQIEELPNGVFSNNVDLVRTHLIHNKIKLIGSTVFDDMSDLAQVNLEGNVCVSKYYYHIEELKKDVQTYCKNP